MDNLTVCISSGGLKEKAEVRERGWECRGGTRGWEEGLQDLE